MGKKQEDAEKDWSFEERILKGTPQPHDALFRLNMQDPKTAREVIEICFPEKIRKQLDLSELKISKTKHTNKWLNHTESDAVLRTRMKTGEEVFCYLLFEHIREERPNLAFRLHYYAMQIWASELKANPKKQLPRLFTCVVYNGQTTFKQSMNLADCFADPIGAQEDILGPYQVVEVNKRPDRQLMRQTYGGLMLANMKYIDTLSLTDYLAHWLPHIEGLDENLIREALGTIFKYWRDCGKIEPDDLDSALHLVGRETITSAGGNMMTLAEMLENKGRQEGQQESKREIAQKMLIAGTDPSFIESVTGLFSTDIQQLQQELDAA